MARFPNLVDMAQSLGPDGQVAAVAEILSQTNEMLADITFIEGNLPTGHRSVVRTGLPTVTWRKFYGGVQPDKSTRAQITDSCGMVEAYAEIDKALADLNNNTAAFRAQEATAFLESMSQELQTKVLYGNVFAEPETFLGMSPRYNDKSAQNADNIIDAGGTSTNNASIWLICWSPTTIHGIIPKGSTAGIKMQDLGEVTVENADGNGGRMQAYRTHFRMDAGIVVRDWRYAVRICNINKAQLTADLSTGANLPDLMFQAVERIPAMSGNCAFYMSRDVRTKYRQQLATITKNSTLSYVNAGGVKSMAFQDEIPIRRVDKLAADEARVV